MRIIKAVPGKGVVSSTVIASDEVDSYKNLRDAYPYSQAYKDQELESGRIRDLLDVLEANDVEYVIYNNKRDNGCTIFYEEEAPFASM